MANTVTIEPIITGITQKSLQATLPALKAFSFGVELGQKSLGDKAKVFLHGAVPEPAAFNKTTNNYTTASDINFSQVEVPLNKLTKITVPVVRQQLRNGLILQDLIDGMIKKMINSTIKDAIALITAADFGAPVHTGVASTMTSDVVADLAGVAADAGWGENMHLLLLTTYYTNLVKDDDLKILGGPDAQEQIKSGIVQTLSGITAHRFPGLAGPAGENLTGFFTDGSALAIGYAENELQIGVEKKLEFYQTVRVEGGPIVSIRIQGSEDVNEAFLTTEVLSGAIKARTAGGRRVISAAP